MAVKVERDLRIVLPILEGEMVGFEYPEWSESDFGQNALNEGVSRPELVDERAKRYLGRVL